MGWTWLVTAVDREAFWKVRGCSKFGGSASSRLRRSDLWPTEGLARSNLPTEDYDLVKDWLAQEQDEL